MEYSNIILEIKDKVAFLTLNKPETLNALSDDLCSDLMDIITKLEDEESVRVLVITGAGRAFSAGGNIKKMQERISSNWTLLEDRNRTLNTHKLLKKIYHYKKPIVMGINGIAAGAGCNLALSGDISIACESATFVQAFIKIGLVPDWGGTFHLVRLIGIQKAKDLIFTGRKVTAIEAEKMNMISRVVPDTDFTRYINDYALNLASSPLQAILLSKNMLNKSYNETFENMLDYEAYAQLVARRTNDHIEGVKAFLEKRKPTFTSS